MLRKGDINDISDGKLYTLNDMVRADCQDCTGCSACCRGMGNSIVLTPYDVCLLTNNLNCGFDKLIADRVELNVIDGLILPSLKMAGENEQCSFLDTNERCSIHSFRPGICRLFPLGRIYDDNGFKYFLQTNECLNNHRSKIKVEKWLDTPDIEKNERFIWEWHELLKRLRNGTKADPDYESAKKRNILLLQLFYFTPYTTNDFYSQIEERMKLINYPQPD